MRFESDGLINFIVRSVWSYNTERLTSTTGVSCNAVRQFGVRPDVFQTASQFGFVMALRQQIWGSYLLEDSCS
jgi:hypothetical protein